MTRLAYLLCIAWIVAVLAGGATAGPKWTGTISVQKKYTRAELRQMARITAAEAARAALAAVPGNAADKKVEETELKVENGYLVYEVEVRVAGQKTEYEVIVDAGSGKVLATETEEDDD